jgi:hypothetical protein
MGTRSLVHIYNEEGKRLVSVYRQFDGYLSCAGKEYLAFINSGDLINGYSNNNTKDFNGMGCFAARFISRFKSDKVGGFYISFPNSEDKSWVEFEYQIKVVKGKACLFYRNGFPKFKPVTKELCKVGNEKSL